MYTEVIKIGNSRGLRIPKAILKQCGIKNVVDLTVRDRTLVITPYEEIRTGWEENFRLMAQSKDDRLLDIGSTIHSYDEEEWEW